MKNVKKGNLSFALFCPPCTEQSNKIEQTTMAYAYEERVMRELCLNSPKDLRSLKTFAFEVGINITRDPRQKKHRTMPVAELPNLKGLSSFLKKGFGFKFEINHGDRLETVLYLPFVEREQALLLKTVSEGLEWLDAMVRVTLLPMAESSRCHPDRSIAQIVIRLHLPTGQIVEGGFQNKERLDCVHVLARSLYKPEMRGKVHLRMMNESAPMIEGFQESSLTLAELGFKSKVDYPFSPNIYIFTHQTL